MASDKVLLVQPNYAHQRKSGGWGLVPPLGLAYIAAVLEENGVETEILDANLLEWSPQRVAQHAADTGAGIVGVSLMTPAHSYAVELARHRPRGVTLVAGGPHATGSPETLLEEGFDIVVRGEGEYTMLEIAQGHNLATILGISFRTPAGESVQNPNRPPLDPNALPLPARHLLAKGGTDLPYRSAGTKYFPWAAILTSRGCPYNCYYCNKSIFGNRFHPRTPENVLGEINHLVEAYKVGEIDFYDDCFNFDMEWAERVMDLIIERNYRLHLRFANGIRADRVNERLLRKMKRAGVGYIAYGIESGDQGVLDKIPKAFKLDTVREAVRMTRKAGIPVTAFFMLGLIGDTEETMQRTIDFAKELDIDVALFNITVPYPGTRMWQLVNQQGEFLLDSWDDFFHTSGTMVYTLPGTASPQMVEAMYRKASREFYFRPSYILKQLLRRRWWREWRVLLGGLQRVLFAQMTRVRPSRPRDSSRGSS